MRKLLTILFCIFGYVAKAQTEIPQLFGSRYYEFKNTVRIDSGFLLPRSDTFFKRSSLVAPGDIRWRPQDSSIYYYNGIYWPRVLTMKDITDLSDDFIRNGTSSQNASFNITGNGIIGNTLKIATTNPLAAPLNVGTTPSYLNLSAFFEGTIQHDPAVQPNDGVVLSQLIDSISPIKDILIDSIHNWSIHGPIPSYTNTKVDDSHTFNLGGDTLINFFRYDPAQFHVSNSDSIMKRISYDGGVTWSDASKVFASDSVDGNQSSGLLNDGTIVIFLRKYDVGNFPASAQIGYIRSTDKGETWSNFTIISPIESNKSIAPFGKIIKRTNGDFQVLFYLQGYCESWISSDNGETWSSSGVVYDFRVSNPDRMLNEPFAANIGSGRQILHARDELIGGPFYQLTSEDDGVTWTWRGRTNIGSDSTARVAPCIHYDEERDILISILTQRHIDNSSSSFQYNTKNDSIIFYINRPNEVFTTPTNYRPISSIKRPEPDNLSLYGYADIAKLSSGSYIGLFTERMSAIPSGEKSHLWQFDVKYLLNRFDDFISRYNGLSPVSNEVTGHSDMLSMSNQGELVPRLDSVAVVRPNGTFLLIGPRGGKNIMEIKAFTGSLFHTFQATGRVLLNGASDDLLSTLQVNGRGRFTSRVAGSDAINSNEFITKSQFDVGMATTVKNNVFNQSVITPFNINGSSSGAANFSIIRGFEADGTTNRWSLGDAASGDTHTYLSSTTDLKLMAGGSVRLNILSNGNISIGPSSGTSLLHVFGSYAVTPTTVTTTTTLDATHYSIYSNNSANITLNLPAASTCTGRIYVIKKISNNAFTIAVDPNGSENIEGSSTPYSITTYLQSITIQSDGTQWWIN